MASVGQLSERTLAKTSDGNGLCRPALNRVLKRTTAVLSLLHTNLSAVTSDYTKDIGFPSIASSSLDRLRRCRMCSTGGRNHKPRGRVFEAPKRTRGSEYGDPMYCQCQQVEFLFSIKHSPLLSLRFIVFIVFHFLCNHRNAETARRLSVTPPPRAGPLWTLSFLPRKHSLRQMRDPAILRTECRDV
jgi:hypothetical protein